jgi:hypothetical protein
MSIRLRKEDAQVEPAVGRATWDMLQLVQTSDSVFRQSSKSTFPPDNTTPTDRIPAAACGTARPRRGRRRWVPPGSSIAAAGTSPPREFRRRSPAPRAPPGFCTIGNVSRPGLGARKPSAMVSGCGTVTRSPACIDKNVSLAPSGSAPNTRMAGSMALAMVAQPESRPPPPTGAIRHPADRSPRAVPARRCPGRP